MPAPPKLDADRSEAAVAAAEAELVAISSLDEYAQIVFRGTKHLNRLQSAVFHTAYHSNENMLVCAPTGASTKNV